MSDQAAMLNDAIGMTEAAQKEFEAIRATATTVTEQQEASLNHAKMTCESVTSVVGNLEEMLDSIGDIEHNVGAAVELSGDGAQKARETTDLVQSLSEAAEKIGSVVVLIKNIASQTNLLALNATIEAARAGEAGKGFAVVAGEVKNLANQTATATEEITAQVTEIQTTTQQALEAITGVVGATEEINNSASAIKDAVARQHSSTEEISRQANDIAQMADTTGQNIQQSLENAGRNRDRAKGLIEGNEALLSTLQDISRAG